MRDIPNFRVWHEEKLWILAKLDLWGDPDQATCDLAPYLPKYEEKFNIPLAEVKLMQSTGLKDKNGVEIYEGDILLFNNDYPKPQKADWKCVIKYRKGSFVCEYLKDGVYNHFDSWNVPAVTWEVIGNIYENPELLETKKTDRRQANQSKNKYI